MANQKDLAVTTPVSGRPTSRFQTSVGCFINLIVTRCQIDESLTISQLVQQVHDDFISGIDHANFPYARLLPELGLTIGHPGEAAFPISFTYQNIFDGWGGSLSLGEVARVRLDVYQEVEDDLTLEVYDFRKYLQINFKYQRRLFSEKTVNEYLECFISLVHQCLEQSTTIRIDQLELVSPECRSRILAWSSGPKSLMEPGVSIVQLIDRHCQIAPDSVAITCDGGSISYSDLFRRSTSIAKVLRQHEIGMGDLIAVQLPRSIEQIIIIIGILRVGAAYLPIEQNAPVDRVAFQLADGGVAGIFRSIETFERIDSPSPKTSFRIAEWEGDRLSYVIYTSGTSGRPKGVCIRHDSLVNLCHAMIQKYEMTASDRVLQFASITFDMSVEEIFPPLVAGATVVLRGDEDLAPERFARLIERHGVTIANLPPSFHSALLTLGENRCRELYSRLRLVSFGGDSLSSETLRFLLNCNVRVFNAYGPTECTVNASVAELTGQLLVHIGRPLPGVKIYIVDENLKLLPPGVKGELCIAGVCVAHGYLGEANALQKSFIPNPFDMGMMYRTGDRARWLNDGVIELYGRLDYQMNIHGHRIEPAEIEEALQRLPGIRKAVVVEATDVRGSRRLVAFYTSDEPVVNSKWKAELLRKLPAYMVPNVFERIDEIPLTAEGKIDRQSLAKRPCQNIQHSSSAPPRTDLERTITQVYEAVLEVPQVGREDDFFELGGHSLDAIQIVGRLGQKLGVEIRLRDFFPLPQRRCFG